MSDERTFIDGVDRSFSEVIALNDLSDVDTTGVASGDFIQFDGAGWVDFDLLAATNTWSALNLFDAGILIGSNLGGGDWKFIDSGNGVLLFNHTTTAGATIHFDDTGGVAFGTQSPTFTIGSLTYDLTSDQLILRSSSDILIQANGPGVLDIFIKANQGEIILEDSTNSYAVAGIVKNNSSGVATGGNSIDISTDTNLAVSSPITLTGDTIGFDFTTANTWTMTQTFDVAIDIDPDQALMTISAGAATVIEHVSFSGAILFGGSVVDTFNNMVFNSKLTANADFVSNASILNGLTQIQGTAGVHVTAASGVLTIGGAGNTNNENLIIDFEQFANEVEISTSTGVTTVGFNISNLDVINIRGRNDSDTRIRMGDPVGDTMTFDVGGVELMKIVQDTQSTFVINGGSVDMDFQVDWDTGRALFVEGSSGDVVIGETTGVALSSALGILTFAGIGNTNNGTFAFDFETTANRVLISSTGSSQRIEISTGYDGIIMSSNKRLEFRNTDSFIRSAATDQMEWQTGGITFFDTTDAAQDIMVINPDSLDIDFQVNSDTGAGGFFVQGSDGFVGIGTTGPTDHLHVRAGVTATDSTFLLSRGNLVDFGVRITADWTSGDVFIDSIGDNSNPIMQFRMRTLGTAVDAMTILGSGFIGIAIELPLTPLHVDSDTAFTLSSTQSGQDTIFITDNSQGSGNTFQGPSIAFGGPGTDTRRAAIVAVQGGSDADTVGLKFYTHPSSGAGDDLEELLYIRGSQFVINSGSRDCDTFIQWDSGTALFAEGSTGNVGFGQSSPLAPVHSLADGTNVSMIVEKTGTDNAGGHALTLINTTAGGFTFMEYDIPNSTSSIYTGIHGGDVSGWRMARNTGGGISSGLNFINYSGTLDLAQGIRHLGDTDTTILATTNDWQIIAGGSLGIEINATGLGFFGVTPVNRPGSTEDIKNALVSLGLLQGTSATPLNLDGGKLTCNEIEINTVLNHDGTTVGLYGTSPAVQSAAYSRDAVITTSRNLLNVVSATIANNHDVISALIEDLQSRGFIG